MLIIQLIGIAIGAFLIALSGALMPGPLLTVTISESLKRGKWAGTLLIIGHGILELSLILVILAGLGHLLKINAVVVTISIMGGLILIWMGWDTVRKAKGLSLSCITEKTDNSRYGPILTGIFASISNPYWTIWWATIGIGYMAASLIHGWIGIAAFFIGHITADLAWYTLISFCITGGRKFLSDRLYHGLLVTCGGILCFFGIIFLYIGSKKMGLLSFLTCL